MKILLAPNSFKGTFSASEVIDIMENCFNRYSDKLQFVRMPIADGGDGTLDFLFQTIGGDLIDVEASDPLLRKRKTSFLMLDNKTAAIEIAKVSGLNLLASEELDPMITTSYGVGEVIVKAFEKGATNIILCVGGSGFHDAGVGAMQALGIQFFDENNQALSHGGKELSRIKTISTDNVNKGLFGCKFTILYDVTNPLTGVEGITKMYAAQKGADERMIIHLEENFEIYRKFIIKNFNFDPNQLIGCGASGGIGASFNAFFDTEFMSGAETLLEMINFIERIKDVDVAITGEGKIDIQTTYDKAPFAIVKYCKDANIPVFTISGMIGDGAEELYKYGVVSMFSCITENKSYGSKDSFTALDLLNKASERLVRTILFSYNNYKFV